MFDENSDPTLFDDIDFSDIFNDQDSDTSIDCLKQWMCQPFPDKSLIFDQVDSSEIFSCDIPLIRKEWLVQDSLSKRQRPPRLYEFLILLLRNTNYETYASFTDRSKGLFQIYQPEKVAELWQAVKSRQSNQKMTYDKFARAIRWYYKSNIMQKTNTRYTFQFSPETLRHFFVDENNNTVINSSSH